MRPHAILGNPADNTEALIDAVAHFSLFAYLDSKRVNIDTVVPQSWVNRISFVFAATFRASLAASMSIALVQCLWLTLSLTKHPVAHIDRLYRITIDPIALLHPESLWRSPRLLVGALAIWLLSLAVVLPPGTLVVESLPYIGFDLLDLPVFNASFISGNGDFSWYQSQQPLWNAGYKFQYG